FKERCSDILSAEDTTNALYLTLFAVLNSLGFRFIVLTDYFSPVSFELNFVFFVLEFLLSSIILTFALKPLFIYSVRQVKSGRSGEAVVLSLALVMLYIGLVWGLVFEADTVSQSYLRSGFIFAAFFTVVHLYLSQKIARRIAVEVGLVDPLNDLKVKRVSGGPTQLDITRQQPEGEDTADDYIIYSHIKPGDVFRVEAGQVVPVDAVIVSGSAELKEVRFSGLSRYAVKSAGQEVYCGSIVVVGSFTCRATASYFDSTFPGMKQILIERLSREEGRLDRFFKYEVLLSVVLILTGVLTGVVWYFKTGSVFLALSLASAVMFCTLGYRAFFYLSSLPARWVFKAFSAGVLLKGSEVLSRLKGVRTLVFDYSAELSCGVPEVKTFELIDSRVDQQALFDALLSLCGGSDEEIDIMLAEYCRSKVKKPSLKLVDECRVYPGKGISGIIESCEFSVGTEEFILARGVQLQASEVLVGDENIQPIYVAVEDDVIARFSISKPFLSDGHDLVERLKKQGIRTVLCGSEPEDKLDVLGQAIGLELVDVFGGLDSERLCKKLSSLTESALVLNERSPRSILSLPQVTIVWFDPVRWNVDEANVVSCSRDARVIADLFQLVRKGALIELVIPVFASFITVAVLALLVLGYADIYFSVFVLVTGNLVMAILSGLGGALWEAQPLRCAGYGNA
ncbi:MAG: hypothetical protein D6719_07280, partial [Candidatus Dadabacteria bacterium]